MKLRPRLEKLERAQVPNTPALLFSTAEGLRDVHNRPVDCAPQDAKVIIGLDPREL